MAINEIKSNQDRHCSAISVSGQRRKTANINKRMLITHGSSHKSYTALGCEGITSVSPTAN